MALIVKDRVLESTTTSGTGAFTLSGATTGYRAFSSVCSVGDTCYYLIEALDANANPSGDWECGLGTYSGTNTLTRTTVQASSNANAAVNFASGSKRVALDATAGYLATLALSSSLGTSAGMAAEWAPNFTSAGDVYIPAVVAMTIDQGNAAIGTGTLTFAKSTTAAPSTFTTTTLPATLQAGAWLKVSAASVTGFVATHLKRTA